MADSVDPDPLTHRGLAEFLGGVEESCTGLLRTTDVTPTHLQAVYRVQLYCLECGGRPVVRCTSHEEGDALIRRCAVREEEGDIPLATPVHDAPRRKRKR